jgi:YD repeat-containing protein
MNACKNISLKTKMTVVSLVAATMLLSGLSMRVDAATTSYTYDSLHRLIRVTYADGSVIRYTYDAAGNRLIQTNH